MEVFKALFCFSEFPRALARISPTFIDNFGTRTQKCSPALLLSYCWVPTFREDLLPKSAGFRYKE